MNHPLHNPPDALEDLQEAVELYLAGSTIDLTDFSVVLDLSSHDVDISVCYEIGKLAYSRSVSCLDLKSPDPVEAAALCGIAATWLELIFLERAGVGTAGLAVLQIFGWGKKLGYKRLDELYVYRRVVHCCEWADNFRELHRRFQKVMPQVDFNIHYQTELVHAHESVKKLRELLAKANRLI